MEQGAREVPLEPVKGRRRHRFRHNGEGEIVDGRHLGPGERFLVAVEEKVGSKDNGVAVKGAQEGFHHQPQDIEGRTNRE